MKKIITPIGSRLLVKDSITELSITQRAAKSGIIAVVDEDNYPKRATTGTIMALGSDPMFETEDWRVGDQVFFGPHAGHTITVEGEELHVLEWQDITNIIKERPEPNPEEATEVGFAGRDYDSSVGP